MSVLFFFNMITFKISFILAFSLKQVKPDKKKQKKKGKDKKGKEKKSRDKKGKKSDKAKKKNKKFVAPPPPKPKHIFEIDKIIGVAHIEYELVPKIIYQIDVVCWGTIAKIYTNDGQKIFKTVVQNEIAWVPIYMEHYLENLPVEELKKYCNHIVDFKFVNNVQKLGKMAKSEKPKKFYAFENEAESENLIEVYYEDPNLFETTFEQKKEEALNDTMKDIILQCANGPKNEFVSWLHYPTNYDNFYEIIKKKSNCVEIECKDFVLPCKPWEPFIEKKDKVKNKSAKKKNDKGKEKKSKSKKDKKSKSKKDKKKSKQDIVTVSVPAEVFFTDPLLAIYKAEDNDGIIKHVFIQFSVDHLITRAQKLMLNPLVIRIKKLSHIPVETLNGIGFSSIYVTYNIPYMAMCQSKEMPIVETIKFNEAHIHFNDTTSKIKFIESIQTHKLFMQIYGTKKPSPLRPPAVLFGNEIEDYSIAKIIPVKYHEEVKSDTGMELLAICAFDISSLIDNIWDFKEKGQCHEPRLAIFHKTLGYYDSFSYLDAKTVNETNINPEYYNKTKRPIPEEMLLSLGTTLQVEVYLLAPQAASLMIPLIPLTFKRLLVIVHSADLAKNIYNNTQKQNGSVYLEKNIEFSETVTGFMIDNGNNFIFFVEGLSNGFILTIWHLIDNSELETEKIFFNTEIAFENRLYTNFLNVGLYPITLKIPLHDILSKRRLYWRGNVPLPCMEALKKLCLICHSSTYKSVIQYNLLPKPLELISLNLEWGVPLRLKEIPAID